MKRLISLCMIIKDEAEQLERCLSSIIDTVDEIIIVDTGSTDNSIDICRKYTAKVFLYEWKDHFADARNYGIQYASGDWILWMDADEELSMQKNYLSEYLKDTPADIISIPVINYHGEDEPVDSKEAFVLSQYRLFRNGLHLKFKQNIHEHLDINESHKIAYLCDSEICIQHYGYIQSRIESKRKSQRNLAILCQNLKESGLEPDPWFYFNIANELQSVKQYELSFNFVNGSILSFLKIGQKPPAIVYRLKYEILIQSNSYDQALPGIDKAIELYPDYVDLHYLKGVILFKKKQFKESAVVFRHCLQLGESHPDYLILRGTGSFRASEKLKQCHKEMDNIG